MATTTSPPFDRNRRANDGDFVDGVKIMAQRLRLLPPFLDGVVTEQAYLYERVPFEQALVCSGKQVDRGSISGLVAA
ncbi:hypothetical protein IQ291_34610 [Burkholderia sp. R-70211]|nr:hypothetical protein [Burkholderia sp. R-70211]